MRYIHTTVAEVTRISLSSEAAADARVFKAA